MLCGASLAGGGVGGADCRSGAAEGDRKERGSAPSAACRSGN